MSDLNTKKTFKEIYDAVKNDRDRAVKTFEDMKKMIENAEKITPGMLDALNGSQQLIQSSTDKLVNLANIMNKKEAIDKATEMNFEFDKELLRDKDSEATVKSPPLLQVGGHKK